VSLKKFVQRTLPVLLLVSSEIAKASSPAITLYWNQEGSAYCQTLVENFLIELRTIATDQRITFDTTQSPSSDALQLHCKNVDVLKVVQDKSEPVEMHYLSRTKSFDANDWLILQQRFLRPLPMLSLKTEKTDYQSSPAGGSNALLTEQNPSEIQENKGSLFQKWWFWSVLGGLAVSAYGVTQLTKGSGANVEIH